jgi:methionine-rich copper-binding protein CopC
LNRRFNSLAIAVAILLAPSLILAASAHQFMAGKATTAESNTITVPLNITNEDNLTAVDIPLRFSEGVTLQEVTFENTRVEYFDLKIANINNGENTVVIGLLPQMTPVPKPDLKAGTGTVANLVFQVDDPAVSEITLEAIEMRNPGHFLAFVYHDIDQNGVRRSRVERPDFEAVTVSLKDVESVVSGMVPETYDLRQNYPNPFNPTTEISFDVPVASKVNLRVYNILGQEVETLIDRELQAGQHTVTWDASQYASGMYFYRIQAENFAKTRKMMLVK